MNSAPRGYRKASDEDIIRLNSIGLSLATIGELLDCHPTTITVRLKSLGINAADTRRSFMEDIYSNLTTNQQKWLADQLGPNYSIKDFMKNLIIKEFIHQTRPAKAA